MNLSLKKQIRFEYNLMGFIMKYKKIMAVALVLLAILTVSAVSASDDVDALATDNIEEAAVDASLDEEISVDGASQLLSSNYDTGNLSSDSQEELGDYPSAEDVEIWTEGYEKGKLYTDEQDPVVIVHYPEYTFSVVVNGHDEYFDEDGDGLWTLEDLGIYAPGEYDIKVCTPDVDVAQETITVYEFKNDELRARLNYDDESYDLYIPEGAEGVVIIITEIDEDGQMVKICENSSEITSEDYGNWKKFYLADYGFAHDEVIYYFNLTVMNNGEAIYSYINSHCVGPGVYLWVSDEEFSTDNRNAVFAAVTVPEDSEGTVMFSFDDDIFFDKDLNDFDKAHIDNNDYYITLGEVIDYIEENLWDGDAIRFVFLDENGDEVKSREYWVFFDDEVIRFEEADDREWPIDDIELIIPNSEDPYYIGDNVAVGDLLIPNMEEFENIEIIVTVTKNGEVMAIFNTSEIEPEYDNEIEAYKYPITLDLTQLSDKDVLNVTLDYYDGEWFGIVEKLDENRLFFHEYINRLEYNVFFGNLTTGDPNDPEIMGWRPHGQFVEICIPDECNINDGIITVSTDDSVLFTKSLSEFEKEFDYAHLGYIYSLNLTEIDLDLIPENKTISVTFISTNYTACKQRIRVGEMVYVIVTPDDVKALYDIDLVNDILTNNGDPVLHFFTDKANPMNSYFELGGGYFRVYVNGTKVDFDGFFDFADDYYGEFDIGFLCGPSPIRELDSTALDLGIFHNGVYNIRVTHTPGEPLEGDESYIIPQETELLNANIVVNRPQATVIVVDSEFSRYATDFNANERGAYFYGTLYDIDGNPLVNKTVQIALNGPIYNVKTDENGRAGVQVNMASANTYTYALFFQGDENYTASLAASSKLKVVKKPTSIIANNMEFKTQAKTKTVTVALSTIKNPYDKKFYLNKGKSLTLSVNGRTYTAKADAKGVAKFNIQITKKGTYTATIKFAGDRTYEAVSKTIKIVISDSPKANKALSNVGVGTNPKNIDAGANKNIEGDYGAFFYGKGVLSSIADPNKKNVTLEVDENFTRAATDFNAGERGAFFYATLKDSDGNVLVNKTVQICVNGPIYFVTTNENGQAGLQVNLGSANTYTYALAFSGEDEYNAAPLASSKLTVTKKPITISASAQTFTASAKTKTVTVTLKTSKNLYDGKTYLNKGKKVIIAINGKTYSGTIDGNGVAKINIGSLTKKGTYNAVINFAGDNTYQSASKTIKITLK